MQELRHLSGNCQKLCNCLFFSMYLKECKALLFPNDFKKSLKPFFAYPSLPWSVGWVALSFLVRCSFVPLWWHFVLLRKKSIFLLFLVRSSSPLPKSCQSFPNEKKRWMWYSTTQIYYLFVKLCLLKFVDWLALPLLLTLFGRRAVHTQIQKMALFEKTMGLFESKMVLIGFGHFHSVWKWKKV